MCSDQENKIYLYLYTYTYITEVLVEVGTGDILLKGSKKGSFVSAHTGYTMSILSCGMSGVFCSLLGEYSRQAVEQACKVCSRMVSTDSRCRKTGVRVRQF